MKKCAGKAAAAGLAAAMVLSMCACGGESSSAAAPAGETQKEAAAGESRTLKIGVLKIADSFPLYVAAQEGMFADQGLDVEIVDFQSASDQSTACEAGELDGMMTDMVVQSLLDKSEGDKGQKTVAMAFGGTKEEGRFLVVSSPDSGITKPEDLEGARIGISENTMMEYLVTSYLKDLGVDLDKVELVNIPKLTLRLDSVIEGNDIQAAILPDPLAIEAVERGCNTVIDDTQLDKNYSQSVVTLSNDLIENDPETVEKFLNAYNQAIEAIDADPDSYADLFYEKANVADDLQDDYQVPTYTADCVPTEEEADSIENWMVSKQLLDEPFTYDELVRQPQ